MSTDTKVGIACVEYVGEKQSVGDIVASAMNRASIGKPDIVFVFASDGVNFQKLYSDIRSVVGLSTPIVGGSAKGLIANEFVSISRFSAVIMAIQTKKMEISVSCGRDISRDEEKVGESLGQRFAGNNDSQDKAFMIFYDPIKASSGSDKQCLINSGSFLLKGIEKTIGQKIVLFGAGLSGNQNFKPGFQFCGLHVAHQHATGILLEGKINVHQAVIPGYSPLDGLRRKITRIRGPVLYEIDGKSAVETINEIFGDSDWQNDSPVGLLLIGTNCWDRYAIGDYDLCCARSIVGVTADGKGILLSDSDLRDGTEVQFFVRDPEITISSVRNTVVSLMKEVKQKGEAPLFGIYISSLPVIGDYWDLYLDEAHELQKAFGGVVPFFGFSCPVQITKYYGKAIASSGLTVITIFSEKTEKCQ